MVFVGKNKVNLSSEACLVRQSDVRLVRQNKGIWIDFSVRNWFLFVKIR